MTSSPEQADDLTVAEDTLHHDAAGEPQGMNTPVETVADDAPDATAASESDDDAVEQPAGGSLSKLDEEGDAAADYLEELLDIADLDGDIDIEVKGGRVYVSIASEEGEATLDSLVGEDGSTLEALQELTRLAVLASTGQRSRFVLDIDGHRSRRADDLKDIADGAIERVKADGSAVALKPMSAYERKIVHDIVAEAGLVSDSEGEGPRRHVVVHPAED